MMIRKLSVVLFSLAGLLFANNAAAQITAESVPLGPYGGGLDNQAASPVALTGNRFLVAARGADGTATTADDLVLLVTVNGPGDVVVQSLATPFLTSSGSNFAVAVSSTSAVIQSRGPDGSFGSDDDSLHILNDLGGTNVVSTISLPYQYQGRAGRPVALGSNSVILSTRGPDGDELTADDELVLVENLGPGATTSSISTPYLFDDGTSYPVLMSADSLVISSAGPDEDEGSADDVVYYVTNLSGAPVVSSVPVPFIYYLSPGTPVPLTPTSFVVSSVGPDESEETGDDELVLVEGLGSTPTVTRFAVPNILDYGGGRAAVLSPTLAVVSTQGADNSEGSADDSVYVLSNIGGSNTLTEVVIGGLDEDGQARCQVLDATRCALTTGGANFSGDDLDDEVVVLSDLGGANSIQRIVVPGLVERIASRISVASGDTVLVANGGPDGEFGDGGDDTVSVISGLSGGSVSVETVPAVGEFDGSSSRSHIPVLFPGSNIAAFISAGTDSNVGTSDDAIRLIFSIPSSGGGPSGEGSSRVIPVPTTSVWGRLFLLLTVFLSGMVLVRRLI